MNKFSRYRGTTETVSELCGSVAERKSTKLEERSQGDEECPDIFLCCRQLFTPYSMFC